ncbi:CPBP family intramembrane metalloprotease [Clostridium sporogenes]|uniref:CPBP family intramembrane metalloprotease n=2 Tax=Clostridium botulinum TaxID=1491 RepID=A0A6M0SUZ2_CLOBO|nr:CPBP family intramembrane glutamic endopeptidase [Clostridium sporogenes]NFA58953.1 CPBP family intramembrane metalloprotease [Clostridium botulinum]NFI73536.1 CPBP family intramembrane metalloprotease [Clostridium sporogenes]NFL71587.1 CPBP family intramembrane metalloprotease [Clostridium sporogenes]NFM25787.1 CPBP family intramembrane metalloprotease [Clostridium sporogenes]NFP61216.1 CPBP family intramembrane metalloprotease [Clostridium sporogenes]
MGLMKKINDKMFNLSKIKFIFTILVFDFIISIIFIPISILYQNFIGSVGGPNIPDLKILFIRAVIIAPLYETLIYQMGVIKLFSLSKKIKNNKLLLIFISAVFFGLSHFYSMLYIFSGFISGILLAYSFIVYEYREKSGFYVTAIIHSLINLEAFIFEIFKTYLVF